MAVRLPDVRAGFATYSDLVVLSDLLIIEAAVGLQIVGASPEQVVSRLNGAALDFIFYSQAEATAGPCAEFAKEAERRCASLASLFEFSRFDSSGLDKSASFMRRWPGPILDSGHAQLDSVQSLGDLFSQLMALQDRLRILAEFHRANPQTKGPPACELALFSALRSIYADAFGKALTTSTHPSTNQPSGPGLRFCQAVLKIIAERANESDLGLAAQRAIQQIHRISPETIAERVRGSGVRRRSGKPAELRGASPPEKKVMRPFS